MNYRAILTDIDYAERAPLKPENFTYAHLMLKRGTKTVGKIDYSSWHTNICLVTFSNKDEEKLFVEEGIKTYKKSSSSGKFLDTDDDQKMIQWYGEYLAKRVINGQGFRNWFNYIVSGRKFGIKVTEF